MKGLNHVSLDDLSISLAHHRKRNSDGTYNVHCAQCGRFIMRSAMAITGTKCYQCDTGEDEPVQMPFVSGMPRPDLISTTKEQEELLNALWAEQGGTLESAKKQMKKKFSPLDLIVGTFKALGFISEKKPKIDEEKIDYQTSDKESSKKVASRKVRTPIFKQNRENEDNE